VAHVHDLEVGVVVLGERAALDAERLSLDQRAAVVDDQRSVAPVGVGGIGAAEAPALAEADQTGDEVIAVGEDHVAGLESRAQLVT